MNRAAGTAGSDSEAEDDTTPIKASPLPTQKTTMLHFFKKKAGDNGANCNGDIPNGEKEKKRKPSESPRVHKSPPAKKDKKDESDSEELEDHPSSSDIKSKTSDEQKPVVDGDGSASKTITDAVSAPESAEKPQKGGIGSFFRTITKKEYIKENEKKADVRTVTVEAMVHSPSPTISVKKTKETDTTKTEKKGSSKLSRSKKGGGGGKNAKKRSSSNYVRLSEETDTIEVVDVAEEVVKEEEEEKAPEAAIADKTVEPSEQKSEESKVKNSDNLLQKKKPKNAETPTTSKIQSEDLDESKVPKISTKQLFARGSSKKNKKMAKKNSEAAENSMADDEDTVDVDFPSVALNHKIEAVAKQPVQTKISTSSLFKTSATSTGGGRKRKKRDLKDLSYDSDSIDVDVLESYNARTFARASSKTGESPPMDTSTDESTSAFSVLMKKPILKNQNKREESTTTSSSNSSPSPCGLKSEAKNNPVPEANNKENEPSLNQGEEAEVNQNPETDNAGGDSGCRRKSARIRRNQEVIDARKREVEALGLEAEETSAAKRPRAASKDKPNKKQRKSAVTSKKKVTTSRPEDIVDVDESSDDIKIEKVVVEQKPIASIFTRLKGPKSAAASQPPKPVDPEREAARKAFLFSAVPDSLKKTSSQTHDDLQNGEGRSNYGSLAPFAFTSTIVHITQIGQSQDISSASRKWPKLKDEQEGEAALTTTTTTSSMAGYHGSLLSAVVQQRRKSSKEQVDRLRTSSTTSSSRDEVSTSPIRLNRAQIYSRYHALRREAAEAGSDFPVTKVFRRYLERKLESDTLEDEARRKNVSLNEIEEERSRGGRRRQLRRRRNSKKKAAAASKKQQPPPVSRMNSKIENGVSYDPSLASSMQWTMKYAPQCADDVIGNLTVVRELASWLGEWEVRDVKRRRRLLGGGGRRGSTSRKISSSTTCYSSDDDFTSGSEFDSDSSAGSEETALPNTALLEGPCGVGKTASVYALAHEMGFKVLEVNASSSRNGRQVLANLREATQSHDVRKRDSSMMDALSAMQQKQSTPSASGASAASRSALILFEDIDLVFEDADEGFYNAVNTLIATTKRPIILTTSRPSFLRMQISNGKGKVLKTLPQAFTFKSVRPSVTSKHLQLLALVEGFHIDLPILASLCTLHEGNISKSMLALQCWTTSEVRGRLSDFCQEKVGGDDDKGSEKSDSSTAKENEPTTATATSAEVTLEALEKEEMEDISSGGGCEVATVARLMSLNKKEFEAATASTAYVGLTSSDFSRYAFCLKASKKGTDGPDEKKMKTSALAIVETLFRNGLGSIFEWYRYSMLPQGLYGLQFPAFEGKVRSKKYPLVSSECAKISETRRKANTSDDGDGKKRWRVNLHLSSSFFAEDSSENEDSLEAEAAVASKNKVQEEGKEEEKENNGEKAIEMEETTASQRPQQQYHQVEAAAEAAAVTPELGKDGESLSIKKEEGNVSQPSPPPQVTTEEKAPDCNMAATVSTSNEAVKQKRNEKRDELGRRRDAMNLLSKFSEAASNHLFLLPICHDDTSFSNSSSMGNVGTGIKGFENCTSDSKTSKTCTDIVSYVLHSTLDAIQTSPRLSSATASASQSTTEVSGMHTNVNASVDDQDLISAAASVRDSFVDVQYREALRSAEADIMDALLPEAAAASNSSATSTDILPVLRYMFRCEDERRLELSTVTKRSRSARFIHYFDSVGIRSNQSAIATLCNSFES